MQVRRLFVFSVAAAAALALLAAAPGTDTLDVKPVKFKKVDKINPVFGIVDYGKGKPIVFFRRQLPNGDYALADMTLTAKRAKAKKYVQIAQTDGWISGAKAIKTDDGILLFYTVGEQMQSSPRGSKPSLGGPWYTSVVVQNVGANGTVVDMSYAIDTYKPKGGVIETSFYPQVAYNSQTDTVFVYGAVNQYGQAGYSSSVMAGAYRPWDTTYYWRVDEVLPPEQGTTYNVWGGAPLPDNGGFVGAAVVQNTGGSELVAIVNQMDPGGGYSTQTYSLETLQPGESFYGSAVCSTNDGVAVIYSTAPTSYSGQGGDPPLIDAPVYYWRVDEVGPVGSGEFTGIDSFQYTGELAPTAWYSTGRVSSNYASLQIQNVDSAAVSVTNYFYSSSGGQQVYQQRTDLYSVDFGTGSATKQATAQTSYPFSSFIGSCLATSTGSNGPLVAVIMQGYNTQTNSQGYAFLTYNGFQK